MSLAFSELPHKWVDIFLVRQKSYIQSGDTVSFYPISRDEFLQLGGEL